MRTTLCLGSLLVLLAVVIRPCAAQSETFIGHTSGGFIQGAIYEIDRSSRILRTLHVVPMGQFVKTVVHDELNSGYYVVSSFLNPVRTGMLQYLTRSGSVTTLFQGAPLVNPLHMVRDGDGNWLILGLANGQMRIFDWTGKSIVQRCVTTVGGDSATIHPETGELLLKGSKSTQPSEGGYFLVDRSTGAWRRYATTTQAFNLGGRAEFPIYDAGFGGFWDLHHDPRFGGGGVLRVSPKLGISTLQTLPFSFFPVDLVLAGSRSGQKPFRVFLLGNGAINLYDMDRKGALTWVSSIPGGGWGTGEIARLRTGSRHLTWFLSQPPHGRRLILSFPGEPGLPYFVGLGLSGCHPGIRLPDGRTIPLNFDGLTGLSLSGGLPGVLSGTVGILSASGTATVSIDVSLASAVLKGMRVVAAAAVVNPSLASPIVAIAGPTGFTVR